VAEAWILGQGRSLHTVQECGGDGGRLLQCELGVHQKQAAKAARALYMRELEPEVAWERDHCVAPSRSGFAYEGGGSELERGRSEPGDADCTLLKACARGHGQVQHVNVEGTEQDLGQDGLEATGLSPWTAQAQAHQQVPMTYALGPCEEAEAGYGYSRHQHL